ncbi:hypothetical protein C2E23DRAFT_257957 [Lenzites betulinus]|nr:hypothetical protein C2E23DRAFT_257957 [Lenzites betulinus]
MTRQPVLTERRALRESGPIPTDVIPALSYRQPPGIVEDVPTTPSHRYAKVALTTSFSKACIEFQRRRYSTYQYSMPNILGRANCRVLKLHRPWASRRDTNINMPSYGNWRGFAGLMGAYGTTTRIPGGE